MKKNLTTILTLSFFVTTSLIADQSGIDPQNSVVPMTPVNSVSSISPFEQISYANQTVPTNKSEPEVAKEVNSTESSVPAITPVPLSSNIKVQIASFTIKENAQKLINAHQNSNMQIIEAYLSEKNQTLYRVVIVCDSMAMANTILASNLYQGAYILKS